ncbi:DUF1254 domain-containing protein (plasmid) [Novosphingobium sp. BL-8A]|uniref:DUF1254 domain-containing protein n=1 Tax=Novosphingobium sp. BL-8A TaxID=3127639 RepID=UPI0037569D5A
MSNPVTVENFTRAESDFYFAKVVEDGGFGKFHHARQPASIDHQTVIRMNRDTIYSSAVVDLDAGPVTIALPESSGRFRSLQVLNEDQYTLKVAYDAGRYRFTREEAGTRYIHVSIRTLVDPNTPSDLEAAHALQGGATLDQPSGPGTFEVPDWDQASHKKVRDALLVLGTTLPDSKHVFGRKEDVDPVRFLIGCAVGWGGNPETEASYLNFTPAQNDGQTVHRLKVKDVPVNGFWSISVYNAKGFFEPNDRNAYSINNLSAVKDPDGSVTVQFGGCEQPGAGPNCIPITQGWNYIVRLYRPRLEILDGRWTFPPAVPIS